VTTAAVTTLVLATRQLLDAGRHGTPSVGTPAAALGVLGATSWGPSFALVLGVLVVTDEFRHGTLTSALLQSPSRSRLLLAKAVTALSGGLALGVVTLLAALSVGVPSEAVTPDVLNSDIVLRSLGLLLAHSVYGLIGAGVGALLNRAQAGAVLLPLVWLSILEPLAAGVVDRRVLPWTLHGATAALAHAGDLVGVLPLAGGAAILLTVGVALNLLGGLRIIRSSVT
jgi:ABC-2 type transport system permease protein